MPLLPGIVLNPVKQNDCETIVTNVGELFPIVEIMPFLSEKHDEKFEVRPLHIDDYDKGYLNVLEDLTVVGKMDKSTFEERFNSMAAPPASYYVIVVEDKILKRIVASITLVLEFKFIHMAGIRGRIEDVVVHHDYRSNGFARLLNEVAIGLAKSKGVYKLSLDCKDELVEFYKKFAYHKNQNFLFQRFD